MANNGRELNPGLKELARQALDIRGYTLMEKVGGGGFGFVYRVVKNNDNYAVKIEEPLYEESKRMQQVKRLWREIRIHQNLNHRNIVKFEEEIALSNGWPIVVMELVTCGDGSPCSLGKFISDLRRPLNETEAMACFRELIRGVEYMHCRPAGLVACHRDIKLCNALVDGDEEGVKSVKLCDFGCSKVEQADSAPKSTVGTLQYLAPELVARTREDYDGKAVDVWCCGILLYHMVTGYTPWDRSGDEKLNQTELIMALQRRISQGQLVRPETLEENSPCWEFIEFILKADPASRPTIAKIKKHHYFTGQDAARGPQSGAGEHMRDPAGPVGYHGLRGQSQGGDRLASRVVAGDGDHPPVGIGGVVIDEVRRQGGRQPGLPDVAHVPGGPGGAEGGQHRADGSPSIADNLAMRSIDWWKKILSLIRSPAPMSASMHLQPSDQVEHPPEEERDATMEFEAGWR